MMICTGENIQVWGVAKEVLYTILYIFLIKYPYIFHLTMHFSQLMCIIVFTQSKGMTSILVRNDISNYLVLVFTYLLYLSDA